MFTYHKISKDILEYGYKIYINQNLDTVSYYLKQLSIEDNEFLYLPKFIDKTNFFREYVLPLINNHNIKYEPANIKKYSSQFSTSLNCIYQPYEYQMSIVNSLISQYKKQGSINGIMQLVPGFGKTFLSSYLANIFRLKTLIIVDETYLFNQWKERLKEYFNLHEDDIGIIRSNNITTQKDTRFTIAYVQTLNSRLRNFDLEYLNEVRKQNFGLVIFDECHKVSASEKYSKISSIFDTANVIGLSGTPYKYSIHKLQLESSIGKVIAYGERYAFMPKLYIVDYRSNLHKYLKGKQKFVFFRTKELLKKRTIYSSLLINSQNFFKKINEVVKYLLDLKHKIMIISTTIESCRNIADMLRKQNINVCELHSKAKTSEEDVYSSNIIVGTYKKCSHGFDRKDISAVIFASPYSGRISIPQIVGRILRDSEDKQQPIVIYLNDLDFQNIFDLKNVVTIFTKEYSKSEIYRYDENNNLHMIYPEYKSL